MAETAGFTAGSVRAIARIEPGVAALSGQVRQKQLILEKEVLQKKRVKAYSPIATLVSPHNVVSVALLAQTYASSEQVVAEDAALQTAPFRDPGDF